MYRRLYLLSKGKTVIMIAHRLSSITGVDCIYVMQDGEIVERHAYELIERNGIFVNVKNYLKQQNGKLQRR